MSKPSETSQLHGLSLISPKDPKDNKPWFDGLPVTKVSLKEMATLLDPERFREFAAHSKIDLKKMEELLGPDIFRKIFTE